MTQKNDVNTAFELLLEEIEDVIEELNSEAQKKIKLREYDKVKGLVEEGTTIMNFREKVKDLQKEWQTLFSSKTSKTKLNKKVGVKKLKKGLRTPEDAFRLPILESLKELGGKAEVRVVLEKVYEKMKHILNEYDKQKLSTGGIRWQNTAQWARQSMVNEGLLKSNSEHGIWEISEKGKVYKVTY